MIHNEHRKVRFLLSVVIVAALSNVEGFNLSSGGGGGRRHRRGGLSIPVPGSRRTLAVVRRPCQGTNIHNNNINNSFDETIVATLRTSSRLWTRFNEEDEGSFQNEKEMRSSRNDGDDVQSQENPGVLNFHSSDFQDERYLHSSAFTRTLYWFAYVLQLNLKYCLHESTRIYSLLLWKATTIGWYILFGSVATMGLALSWKWLSMSLLLSSFKNPSQIFRSLAVFCTDFCHGGWFAYKFPFLVWQWLASASTNVPWVAFLPIASLWLILDFNPKIESSSDANNDNDNANLSLPELQEEEKIQVSKFSRKLVLMIVQACSILAELCGVLDKLTLTVLEFPLLFFIKLPATVVLSAVFFIRMHVYGRGKSEADFQQLVDSFHIAKYRISSLGLTQPPLTTNAKSPLFFESSATNMVFLGPLKEELQFRFLYWKLLAMLGLGKATLAGTGNNTRACWEVVANSLLFGMFHIGNYFPLSKERHTAWLSSMVFSDDDEDSKSKNISNRNDTSIYSYAKKILPLAMGQCLNASMLALLVLNPLYLNRGFAAALGAHVAINGTVFLLLPPKDIAKQQ